MVETTMCWIVDVRAKQEEETPAQLHPGLALGELLYRVLFGDERIEPARPA